VARQKGIGEVNCDKSGRNKRNGVWTLKKDILSTKKKRTTGQQKPKTPSSTREKGDLDYLASFLKKWQRLGF